MLDVRYHGIKASTMAVPQTSASHTDTLAHGGREILIISLLLIIPI